MVKTARLEFTGVRVVHWKWWLAAIPAVLLVAGALGANLRHGQAVAAMVRSDPETILSDKTLRQVAIGVGGPVYQSRCASCHGAQAKGDVKLGAPDLTSGEHLYGQGRVAEIEFIARHGIRSGDKRGWNLASMPAYASLQPYKGEPLPSLTPGQIEDLTQYLLLLAGGAALPEAAQRGSKLFHVGAGCYDCHGQKAEGDPSIGAPSLVGHRWIYGDGSHDDIYRTLSAGRAGMSPAFEKILSAAELRGVAVYVACLSGGPIHPAQAE